ncbi:MAG: HAMP domain-containing histidine kinase [Oscillibacter sp.]|jgi:signal transduction histidine kinase|nr:HAMP domain-containing histidine kinase [Oscillibacter sp.]
MELESNDFSSILPNAAAQLRNSLGNLYLAAKRLAPAADRETDPGLDAKAALVDQSYYQMLRLVNNLEDVGSLDSDRPYSLQDVDIAKLVEELFEKTASLAALRGLNTRLLCPMESHICACCPDALERLMFHLLSNAFKFTPAGGMITVELSRIKGRVLLSVADTGPGIPKERRLSLFRPCPGSAPTPFGMGLGLALSQRIARGLGGVLYLDQAVSQGSRFVLSIPDRLCGDAPALSDKTFDYSGGFNRSLLGLADALPTRAFLLRNQ